MKTHILLLDDDKDELTFFMDALKLVPHDDGFKCTYASNGQQAIEILKHLIPDFIFVDFKMNGMNGLQFLAAIGDLPSLQKTKIYLYSMFANDNITSSAIKLGAKGSIRKTFKITGLSDDLEKILALSAQPAFVFSAIQ